MEKILVQTRALITADAIRELDPAKTYVVSVQLPKEMSDTEKQTTINKTELAFKALGIKNIKAVQYISSIFEIKN